MDRLRAGGKKAGLIRLRFMRPFPKEELLEAASRLRCLGVFDRSVAFNSYGPVFTEVRNALYGSSLTITDHIAGLGGRDLTPGGTGEGVHGHRGQHDPGTGPGRLLA